MKKTTNIKNNLPNKNNGNKIKNYIPSSINKTNNPINKDKKSPPIKVEDKKSPPSKVEDKKSPPVKAENKNAIISNKIKNSTTTNNNAKASKINAQKIPAKKRNFSHNPNAPIPQRNSPFSIPLMLNNNNLQFNNNFSHSPTSNNRNPNQRRIDPVANPIGFLQNFFAGFGVEFPVPEEQLSNNNNRRLRLQDRVHRHIFDESIYDQSFHQLGSELDDDFRDNFSSNFRSNMEREIFEGLYNVIQGNRFEDAKKGNPPTKLSVLKNLKKFPLSEKYCKKDDKGELEQPNCCICLNDIKMKELTVLLPCGHLYHWKCALIWLKKNSTCPFCRFQLPAEKIPFNFK